MKLFKGHLFLASVVTLSAFALTSAEAQPSRAIQGCRAASAEINLGGNLYYGYNVTLDLRSLLGLYARECQGVAIRGIQVEASSDFTNRSDVALLVNGFQAGPAYWLNAYRQILNFSAGYRNVLDHDVRNLHLRINGNVRLYRVQVLFEQRLPDRPYPPYPPESPGNPRNEFFGSVALHSAYVHTITVNLRNNNGYESLLFANQGLADAEIHSVEIRYVGGWTQYERVGLLRRNTSQRVVLRPINRNDFRVESVRVSAQAISSYGNQTTTLVDMFGTTF